MIPDHYHMEVTNGLDHIRVDKLDRSDWVNLTFTCNSQHTEVTVRGAQMLEMLHNMIGQVIGKSS